MEKRSRLRSKQCFRTGELSETCTVHKPVIVQSTHIYRQIVHFVIRFCASMKLEFARYETVFHKNTTNKCGKDSSRFSLHFLWLERVQQADSSELEALFRLSCSLCLTNDCFLFTTISGIGQPILIILSIPISRPGFCLFVCFSCVRFGVNNMGRKAGLSRLCFTTTLQREQVQCLRAPPFQFPQYLFIFENGFHVQ